MFQEIDVSVVIRTRNKAKSLRQTLEALAAQRCSFKWELVVVDNESQDETAELCNEFNAQVVSIPCNEFTPGRALNLGIRHARGEFVLLCSDHSVPVGSSFLESSVAPFADTKMAAVRCLLASDKEKAVRWHKPRDIQYESTREQQVAELTTDWLPDYPSATCCVIRRSVWEQLPFDEKLEAVEDKLWASEILKKGYKIRSCAESVFVYNASRGSLDALMKEYRQHRSLYRNKGYVPLSWPRFFLRMLRWALAAPLVAIRYFLMNVARDASLVLVPLKNKSAPPPGTNREYR